MVKKENEKIRMKNTHSRGGISCNWGITVQKESHLKEAICENAIRYLKPTKMTIFVLIAKIKVDNRMIYFKCEINDNKNMIIA